MTKNPRGSKNTAAVLIVFVVIGAVVAMAVLFPNKKGTPAAGDVTVKVPLIVTKLKAVSDGNEYTVQSRFAVAMDQTMKSKISSTLLYEQLTVIMQQMDLDAIAAPDGLEYVKEYATEALNTYLTDYAYTVSKVFVTDLYVGDRVHFASEPNQRDTLMKGLFQGMD